MAAVSSSVRGSLPGHWLVAPVDLWSLADLCAVASGELAGRLRSAVREPWVGHLGTCLRCRARGHVCEVCHAGRILFPPEFGQVNSTAMCPACGACFHRACLANPSAESCPRCVRRRLRSDKQNKPLK